MMNQMSISSFQTDDEPAFLAMTYGGLIPNIGFNAHAASLNAAIRFIPAIVALASRACLRHGRFWAARTPAKAIRHMLAPHRAAGYNHLLATKAVN